jgi:predicted ATPase
MIINSIEIKNFKSFGNEIQRLELSNEGNLILMSGRNGAGKCVHPTTEIEIEMNIDKIIINDRLIHFLLTTDLGNKFLLYVKEKDFEKYKSIINR